MSNAPRDTWTEDALRRGDVAAVKRRVVDDPNYLSSCDYLNSTPLLKAIGFDNADLVEFMLGHGADPNVDVDDGYTCLLLAAESDDAASLQIMRLLIAAGADIHGTGTNGWMPLHMAAAWGEVEKVRLLLGAGADVNALTSTDQRTPLMVAAHSGHPPVTRLLLQRGADATLRDSISGRTALDMAVAAQKGMDPESYERTKREREETDLDAWFQGLAEAGASTMLVDSLRSDVEATDLAESAREEADQLARDGDHEGVIRILAEHAESADVPEPE